MNKSLSDVGHLTFVQHQMDTRWIFLQLAAQVPSVV